MLDALAHYLFIFLGPMHEMENCLPNILHVLDIFLGGQITSHLVLKSLSDGYQNYGNRNLEPYGYKSNTLEAFRAVSR